MSSFSVFKQLVFGIAISLFVTASPICSSANEGASISASKSLEQGFRGIPWNSSSSLLKKKGFILEKKEEGWDHYGFIDVYNFDNDLSSLIPKSNLSTDTMAIYNFRNDLNFGEMREITSKIHYYKNEDENLSLGENLKFEKIYYVVNNGKFMGVCMYIDNEKSGYGWYKDFPSMFPNLTFLSFRNGRGTDTYYVAKLNPYTKIGYSSRKIMIVHMPKDIQDTIDSYRCEVEKEKKKKDAMTGGTF